MSHSCSVSTITSSIAATGVVPVATAAKLAAVAKHSYPIRPAYEAGYDELDSYAVNSRGEVQIVRPRLAISVERGFRRGF